MKFAVVGCAGVGGKSTPVSDCLIPCSTLWCEAAAFEVGEGGLVRSDHTCARTGFDAHVADGHAAFHREGADGGAGILDDIAGSSVRADTSDDVEDDVLRRD